MPAPNVPVPTTDFLSNRWEEGMLALNDALAILRNQPHTFIPLVVGVPPTGLLALPGAALKLMPTENAQDDLPAHDEVTRIDLNTLADGMSVSLELAIPGQEVTVRHLVGAGAQLGEIDLAGDVNLVLATKAHKVVLQRRGTRVVEVGREGYGAAGAGLDFNADIDAQGVAFYNLTRRVFHITTAVAPITVLHRDGVVHVFGSSVALPTSPTGWRPEDSLLLVQRGGEMLITPATNLVNPLNHDRGYGVGGSVLATVHETSNPLKWRISGFTKAAGSGGVLPPPGGTGEINRTAVFAFGSTSVNSDPGSILYKEMQSLPFTPQANEQWAFIAGGGFSGTGGSITNRALAQMRLADETEGPRTMAGRYSNGIESAGLVMVRTFGATPGAKTALLEAKPSVDTNSVTIAQPSLVGIRLEPDEHAFSTTLDAATVAPHTSPVDAASYTGTFAADDYVIIAGAEWETSASSLGAVLSLMVDNVEYGLRTRPKDFNSPLQGAWGVVKPITLTAGTHTIRIRIKTAAGGTHVSKTECANIIVLKKSRFQEWYATEDPTVAPTQSTTATPRRSITGTFLAGYDYLVLGSANLGLSIEASNVQVRHRLSVDGAQFGPEIRSAPRGAEGYHSMSGIVSAVFRGDGTSTVVSLDWYGSSSADIAYSADAALMVLPLKRAA